MWTHCVLFTCPSAGRRFSYFLSSYSVPLPGLGVGDTTEQATPRVQEPAGGGGEGSAGVAGGGTCRGPRAAGPNPGPLLPAANPGRGMGKCHTGFHCRTTESLFVQTTGFLRISWALLASRLDPRELKAELRYRHTCVRSSAVHSRQVVGTAQVAMDTYVPRTHTVWSVHAVDYVCLQKEGNPGTPQCG